jgi:uncharacterized protein
MSLLATVKSDLKAAMKAKDEVKKNTLRMIIGEVPRLNKKAGEEPTDNEIQAIIEKLIKSELMVLEASGVDEDTSDYVNILKGYLPTKMTAEEISTWIDENVNLDEFNPKAKAMGFIMKSLKGKADGNLVRGILLK